MGFLIKKAYCQTWSADKASRALIASAAIQMTMMKRNRTEAPIAFASEQLKP
jgi:hypothetical protein